MPNSLRAKLSSLRYKGKITEEEYKDLISKLDGHDKALRTPWIPIKTREMTEEEQKHYVEYTDYGLEDLTEILDCKLPDDGEEVLVSTPYGVDIDTFNVEINGCYFEKYDMDDVEAWMPKPERYKKEGE